MIQSNYEKEIRTRSLLTVMAFLAISISMLGIFGLGVFTAQKRTKEIGIRKVNGAKVWEAWYFMHRWLESFADKTGLSWWVFALSVLMALVVALLTVSWQSWRAATRNPVEYLRYE